MGKTYGAYDGSQKFLFNVTANDGQEAFKMAAAQDPTTFSVVEVVETTPSDQ